MNKLTITWNPLELKWEESIEEVKYIPCSNYHTMGGFIVYREEEHKEDKRRFLFDKILEELDRTSGVLLSMREQLNNVYCHETY